jgi:hypothetical protein
MSITDDYDDPDYDDLEEDLRNIRDYIGDGYKKENIARLLAKAAAYDYLYYVVSPEHEKAADVIYRSEMKRHGFPIYTPPEKNT